MRRARWEEELCRGERETGIFPERDIPVAEAKMRIVSWVTRSAMHQAGVIDVGGDAAGGRAAASLVADSNGKGNAGPEEGGLKTNGIQQGAKSVPPACNGTSEAVLTHTCWRGRCR